MPDQQSMSKQLSSAIIKLSDASNQILNEGLNEKALIVLLADSTKLSKRTIGKVLQGINELRAEYTHGQ